MFGKKKVKIPKVSYNPETQIPVLRCSICNGEKVAGFKDIATGKITEVCVIKNDSELDEFIKLYNINSITKIY